MIYDDQLAAARDATARSVGTQGGELDFALLIDGLAGRARAGHHHRRRLPLLRDRQAQVHHRRHAGPRAVHAQHGHRRLDRRPGHHPDRRPQRRPDPDPPALASSCRCWASGTSSLAVNKMDLVDYSTRRLRAHRATTTERSPPSSGCATSPCIPMSALKGDNVARASDDDAVVRGPAAARPPGDGARSTSAAAAPAVPLAGAVGHPPQSRLPRLRRHDRLAASCGPGDEVMVLPSGKREPRRRRIVTYDGDLDEAVAGQAVTADAGRRDRRQPRRHAGRRRRAARGRRPDRGHARVDGRGADAARPAVSG